MKAPVFEAAHFKEFVVNFDATGKTRGRNQQSAAGAEIFGGHDLSGDFPELGQSALYCVTEAHSKQISIDWSRRSRRCWRESSCETIMPRNGTSR